MTRSQVIGNDGKGVLSDARSSYGAFLSKYVDDTVIKSVAERISKWTFVPRDQAEIFYLLKYEIGQQYKPHTDWFPRTPQNDPIFASGGQRIATVISYLSEVEGGETFFPHLNIQVKPSKGDAILFWNVMTNGTEDPRTLHGSKPVTKGVKWAMTRWLREFTP